MIDRRHGKVTTAVTSKAACATGSTRAMIATAILVALATHAIQIDIDGRSYRQRVARSAPINAVCRPLGLPETDRLPANFQNAITRGGMDHVPAAAGRPMQPGGSLTLPEVDQLE
ncbi:MAG: hypothetical protein IPM35_31660, partial [Myxococcales bacterium]|nr:hypothetical protein [Myxococcales bacterium]